MANNGKILEQLVAKIQDMIKENPMASVRNNVRLKDVQGMYREFDVIVETINQGLPTIIAFECKDYSTSKSKTKVDVKVIDGFVGKCTNFPQISKKVIVSTTGFSDKARRTALQHDVILLHLDEVSLDSVEASNMILHRWDTRIVTKWTFIFDDISVYCGYDNLHVYRYADNTIVDVLGGVEHFLSSDYFIKERFEKYVENGRTSYNFMLTLPIDKELYLLDKKNIKHPINEIWIPIKIGCISSDGRLDNAAIMAQGTCNIRTETYEFDSSNVKVKLITANDKQKILFEQDNLLKEPILI